MPIGVKGIQKGQIFTDEHRRRISEARKKMTGEKSGNWKGGVYVNNVNEYAKKWRLLNIAKVRIWDKLNKRNRKKATGSYTQEDWEDMKRKYKYSCVCCGRSEPIVKLTTDHIIPISGGGTNTIDNIQPLCKNCNSHKHKKIIKYI